ncbi:signal peptide peptidase SppA [Spongiimicrobium salis]|uniref:signal peptide peptidase SppA n=1 Tax=Spongiimicrobium salis TaxID=1667022 RepID=UPI00374C9C3B
MKFLGNVLASILGVLIAFGILFFMFLIFVSLLGSPDDSAVINRNSVLELRVEDAVNDYVGNATDDPFSGFFDDSQGLDEIIHAIQIAKEDTKIKGISINNNFLIAGLAQTQAIRNALKDFKESGKFIYVYGDIYTQKDYYLASVADQIYINPVGGMDFKGLASEVLFFKDLQEKTGVKMEVIRHGKYKSAVEPYLANEISEANRTQIKELIGSLWNSMLEDISEDRDLSIADLNGIADTLGGRTPELAKASGLIDDIVFYDEYEAKIKKAMDVDETDAISYTSLKDYISYANTKKVYSGRDKIAIVYAQGEILYGEGGPNTIGQGIINRALIKAREDDRVKAVVLRVNSPGGSALVSDVIWREVALTKTVKPVVVSMGDVAASGGYYIAVGADKIFAEPTTITGSIGVFGTIPNMSELAGRIGVNAEQIGTNKNAVDYSLFDPMTDNFRALIQEGIEETYQTFLNRVAQGRNITVEEADEVAQGRVWSGVDAQRLGLVDELGSLDDAIAEAANMAGLDTYGIRSYPKYKSAFDEFMEDFAGASVKTKERFIEEEIGSELYGILKDMKAAMNQKGVQARMPFSLRIQ